MSNVLRLFCMTVEFAEGMAKFSAYYHEAACYCVKCKWLLLRLRIPILFFENDQFENQKFYKALGQTPNITQKFLREKNNSNYKSLS